MSYLLSFILALGAAALRGKDQDELVKFILLANNILTSGLDVRNKMQELTFRLQRMVAEDRPPTPEEWAELRARSDAAHDIIQGN